jgi:L-cysteine desulfidase
MMMSKIIELIQSEMMPSMGCTEPVAIGLAVSRTCEYLNRPATHLEVHISSNIFKNAYSVMIPNAGKPGIELACALGHLLHKPGDTMELFSRVTEELVKKAEELVANGFVDIHVIHSSQFYIEVYAMNETEKAHTITIDKHDNMVKAEKDGVVFLDTQKDFSTAELAEEIDIRQYGIADFVRWAEEVEVDQIRFLKDAVDMNLNISKRGMERKYAMGIGPNLQMLQSKGLLGNDLVTEVKKTVAAACDFRMSGGNGAVMTVLGSGNQGIEILLPAAVTAKWLGCSDEKMMRAEMISILITMYLKKYVGRLSPICGAALAGAGSSGAITWLLGGGIKEISGAVQNMLGSLTGMLCDGAKGGCALKLATCAGEAVYSAYYAMEESIIQDTDGIISARVEDTAKNVAVLSTEGMANMDSKIIEVMLQKKCTA